MSHFEHMPVALQKQSQRDLNSMKDLMEICCLWVDISPQIEVLIGKTHHEKVCEMFVNGSLNCSHVNSGIWQKTM